MNSMKYPNPFITAHVAGLLLIALLFGAVKIVLPMLGTFYLYAMVIFTCFVYVLTMLMAALALRRIGQPPWYDYRVLSMVLSLCCSTSFFLVNP